MNLNFDLHVQRSAKGYPFWNKILEKHNTTRNKYINYYCYKHVDIGLR